MCIYNNNDSEFLNERFYCFSLKKFVCRKSRPSPTEITAGWTHFASEKVVCRGSNRRERWWEQLAFNSKIRFSFFCFNRSNHRSMFPIYLSWLFLQMTCRLVLCPWSTYLPRFHSVLQTWRCTWKRCPKERQWRVTDILLQLFHLYMNWFYP